MVVFIGSPEWYERRRIIAERLAISIQQSAGKSKWQMAIGQHNAFRNKWLANCQLLFANCFSD
jgi:hypothetical protein